MSLVPITHEPVERQNDKWINKFLFSISLLTFMLAVIAAVSHWPVPLTEGGDVGEALVTGRVVVSVGRARVWHRGPLLLFITLLRRFLLISAQLQLPAVHKQGLVVEWLLEGREGGCKNVWDGRHSFSLWKNQRSTTPSSCKAWIFTSLYPSINCNKTHQRARWGTLFASRSHFKILAQFLLWKVWNTSRDFSRFNYEVTQHLSNVQHLTKHLIWCYKYRAKRSCNCLRSFLPHDYYENRFRGKKFDNFVQIATNTEDVSTIS